MQKVDIHVHTQMTRSFFSNLNVYDHPDNFHLIMNQTKIIFISKTSDCYLSEFIHLHSYFYKKQFNILVKIDILMKNHILVNM